MTAYRVVLWLLGVGAVVFVGAAGATVYQVLAPQQPRLATAVAPAPLADAAPVATAMAEPQPVAPPAPPSAPQAAVPPAGNPVARPPAKPVVVARPPIHRPAVATLAPPIPAWRFGGYPRPAAVYVYPRYYTAYAGYRPYAYYRVY